MSALTSVFAQGTHASRPAAASTNNGWFYFETDTKVLFQSNGSSWVQLAPAATAGALTRITQLTSDGTGTYTSFSFTPIPGSYTDIILTYNGRTTDASNQQITVRVNNDSGANYDYQLLQVNNTTVSAAQSVAGTSIAINTLPGTGVTAGAAAAGEVLIPLYAGTTFWKQLITRGFLPNSVGSGGFFIYEMNGEWRSTSAITRVDLIAAAGNWVSGSIATLWGRT